MSYETIDGYYVDPDTGALVPVGVRDPYNELDQHTDDMNVAGIAPGGGYNSDIEQLVQYNNIQQARDGLEAAPVDINPASVRRLADPKLGDQATCVAGGPAMQVVRWQGDPRESRVCSVTIGYPSASMNGTTGTITPTSGTPANRAYANVSWGTRNFVNHVTIDVGKGVQFSVVASKVIVSVGLDLSGSSTGSIVLGASMGFFGGASGNVTGLTRTVYIDSLGGGSLAASTSFKVPAGARQLLPIQRVFSGTTTPGTTPTPVPLQIDFYDINANAVGSLYGGDTAYSVMSGSMPLPNDAYSATITNMSSGPAVALTARLVFGLL